jgi:YD repeat-containing protein
VSREKAVSGESGTVSYTYDSASNLLTRTDARGYVTTYGGYDALNRPTTITYSDGTPTVTLGYDAVANSNGAINQHFKQQFGDGVHGLRCAGAGDGEQPADERIDVWFHLYLQSGRRADERDISLRAGGDDGVRCGEPGCDTERAPTNYITQTAYLSIGGIISLTRGNTLWYLEGYN